MQIYQLGLDESILMNVSGGSTDDRWSNKKEWDNAGWSDDDDTARRELNTQPHKTHGALQETKPAVRLFRVIIATFAHYECKDTPLVGRTAAERVRCTLLQATHRLCAPRICPRHVLSSRQRNIQRLQSLPLLPGEGRHHWPRPLPWSRTSRRSVLLGQRRCAHAPVVGQHIQGD